MKVHEEEGKQIPGTMPTQITKGTRRRKPQSSAVNTGIRREVEEPVRWSNWPQTPFSKVRKNLAFKNIKCSPLHLLPIDFFFFKTLSGFGWDWIGRCQNAGRKSACSHSVSGPTRSRRELDSQVRVCFHLISRTVLQTYRVRLRCQTSGCFWKKTEPLEICSFSAVRKNAVNTKGRELRKQWCHW